MKILQITIFLLSSFIVLGQERSIISDLENLNMKLGDSFTPSTYVVDTENTGVDIASNFIYITFAIAVPNSASITMQTIDSNINGSDVKSENGKSEKNSTIKAGINMNKKLINTIPSAGIFGSLYFRRFALTAQQKAASTINIT